MARPYLLRSASDIAHRHREACSTLTRNAARRRCSVGRPFARETTQKKDRQPREKDTGHNRPCIEEDGPICESGDESGGSNSKRNPDQAAKQAEEQNLHQELVAISPRRAPRACRRPISRVRSVTDTSIMFMMPMPPTRRDTDAMAARRIVSVRVAAAWASIAAAGSRLENRLRYRTGADAAGGARLECFP